MVKKITNEIIVGKFTQNYAQSYYLRELAEHLDKPHQTIKPYLDALVREKVLHKNVRKKITEYALNIQNPLVVDFLVTAEKQRLGERLSQDIYLKTLFEKLSPFFVETTFILFGSAVIALKKGSDVDLLIVGSRERARIRKCLDSFEEIYGKRIHWVCIAQLSAIGDTLLREVYTKHIILNNTEQVLRFLVSAYEQNKLV